VYLALYLQQGRGLEPLASGLIFSVLAVAYVVVSGPAPGLTARYGRAVIATGGAGLALGFAAVALAAGADAPIAALLPGLVLVGAGIGLCFTPLTSMVLAGVDPARAGAASGILSTTQQVGYALGVAVTGLIYFAVTDAGHAFELSLVELAALAAGIVAMTRLLPRPAGETAGAAVPAPA
jgi:MFS family permease